MDARADSYAHCEQVMEEEIDYIDKASKILECFHAAGNETAATNANAVLNTQKLIA
jgi:hypothetical protein